MIETRPEKDLNWLVMQYPLGVGSSLTVDWLDPDLILAKVLGYGNVVLSVKWVLHLWLR